MPEWRRGTLYLYFPTKEALFEGVLTQLLGETVARLEFSAPDPDESTGVFTEAVAGALADR